MKNYKVEDVSDKIWRFMGGNNLYVVTIERHEDIAFTLEQDFEEGSYEYI